MILHHVAHRARLFKISPAPFHANVLAHRHLHVLDRLAVPQLLKQRVGKPEHHDVLHRLLAQIVVNPENLPLAHVPC